MENKTGNFKCVCVWGESRSFVTISHFRLIGLDVLMMRLLSGKPAYKTGTLQPTSQIVVKKKAQASKEKLRLMGQK